MSNRNELHFGPGTRNEKRAERAYRALQAYGMAGDVEEAATDLLTDLRHLGDQYGWTLDELACVSADHYFHETHEDS